MNTITDVIQLLIRLAPLREEAEVSKALSILEEGREKLDNFVHGVESKGEAVETEIQSAVPTAENSGTKVAGL
jgi:hypothetical protein